MKVEPFDVLVERTATGYHARSIFSNHSASDESLSEVKESIRKVISYYRFGNEEEQKMGALRFTYTLASLFGKDSILNAKALAERIGMNPGLLSQYISGAKIPSEAQLQRIMEGVRAAGAELARLQAVIATPSAREREVWLPASEPQETREAVLTAFLLDYRDDCNFSYSSKNQGFSFRITAFTDDKPHPTLSIGLPADHQEAVKIAEALDKVVEDVLELRYNLAERKTTDWKTGETIYPVLRQRGQAYKLFMIDAFLKLYQGYTPEMVSTDAAFLIKATSKDEVRNGKATLILNYNPKRKDEQEAFEEAVNTFPKRFPAE